MNCDRLDILDERLRRIRSATERLDEEHTTVRDRVEALEAAVGESPAPDRRSTPSDVRVVSTSPESESESASESEHDEASDEDVAAAVRAAEDDPPHSL